MVVVVGEGGGGHTNGNGAMRPIFDGKLTVPYNKSRYMLIFILFKDNARWNMSTPCAIKEYMQMKTSFR